MHVTLVIIRSYGSSGAYVVFVAITRFFIVFSSLIFAFELKGRTKVDQPASFQTRRIRKFETDGLIIIKRNSYCALRPSEWKKM